MKLLNLKFPFTLSQLAVVFIFMQTFILAASDLITLKFGLGELTSAIIAGSLALVVFITCSYNLEINPTRFEAEITAYTWPQIILGSCSSCFAVATHRFSRSMPRAVWESTPQPPLSAAPSSAHG